MPQSSTALRHKAEALRLLRHSSAAPVKDTGRGVPLRPVWAREPWPCAHGTCLALEVRGGALWVHVRDAAGQTGWAPIARVLSPEARRTWARRGFG